MLRRTRTTKTLARRIDLQYFTRPHGLRRWRFWLSLTVSVLALGWLLTQRVQGGQKAYSSGPLSSSHAVFTQQCSLCHVTRAGAFFRDVKAEACLACHDAPVHHQNQTFTPACSSCHLEHRGSLRLAATSEASCTQCHADLRVRGRVSLYAASVSSFERNHPEFSLLTKAVADPGGIRLNHYLHMQPNLVGPVGKRVQMSCEDCHQRSGEQRALVYAGKIALVALGDSHGMQQARAGYMLPVRFSNHCAACHTLQFDGRFGEEQVPHDKPEVVHAFLVEQFQKYITANPAAIHQAEPPNRQVPGRVRTPRLARNAAEWVQYRVDDAEWLLWSKTCKQCHTVQTTSASLPAIAPAEVRTRWLLHAEFDHHAHRMMACVACHTGAPESHNTADVLLPSIKTCRECHRDSNTSQEVAEGRCFECHRYHDWSKAHRPKGQFSIPELRGTAQLGLPR